MEDVVVQTLDDDGTHTIEPVDDIESTPNLNAQNGGGTPDLKSFLDISVKSTFSDPLALGSAAPTNSRKPPPSLFNTSTHDSISESLSTSSFSIKDPSILHSEKTPAEMKRLEAAIHHVPLFQDLESQKQLAVIRAMKETHYGVHEPVFVQGEEATQFYVVESGTLDGFKRMTDSPKGEDNDKSNSNDAMDMSMDVDVELLTPYSADPPLTYAEPNTPDMYGQSTQSQHSKYGRKFATYGPDDILGELALMNYEQNQTATVIPTSPCTLWTLDRAILETALLNINPDTCRVDDSPATVEDKDEGRAPTTNAPRPLFITEDYFLAFVPFLRSLTDLERAQLETDGVLQTREFEPREQVLCAGDTGKEFFVVEDGEAEAFWSTDEHEEEEKLQSFMHGDYFGGE